MKIKPVQAVLVAVALAMAAILAEVLAPHQLMASAAASLDLEKSIPKEFGDWRYLPNVGLVTPSEPAGYVEPDQAGPRIYSQELGRGYINSKGQVVMLLVAYGPVQNYRLKAHRPEICYTAAGFRVLRKFDSPVSYRDGAAPLKAIRITTERETRFEPVTYWMRVGNDIAGGIVERQLIRLKYGLQGLIPDGALVRVSTVGIQEAPSYKLQDQFIHDLLAAVAPGDRRFLIGEQGTFPVAAR